MTNKSKLLILCSLLVIAFAAGRETKEAKIVTVEKQVEKVVYKDRIQQVIHNHIITVKEPNGDTETEDTSTISDILDHAEDVTKAEMLKQTVTPVSPIFIQGVVSQSFKGDGQSYGVSISKQVLGPIVIGVFGLSNLQFGMTMGIAL